MKCAGGIIGGGDCFDPACLSGGCQGFDVAIEAVTVVHTSVRSRRPVVASASLIAGGSTSSGRATHDSGRVCYRAIGRGCDCAACR